MPYAFGARFDPERECLPGTRDSLICEIIGILGNPCRDVPQVCLLTGVAGSGKSTVAHSIAHLFDGMKRLGSSYFFYRTEIASRNPNNLFSTIARDLSDLPVQVCPLENRETQSSASKKLHHIGPTVIVIDALDESGDRASRQQLLHTISQKIAENALPTHLRFLITARAEEDIITALPPGPRIVRKVMDDIPPEIVDQDVERFIRHALRLHFDFKSYLDNERCQDLVRHSQQLFQWASAACSFINGSQYHELGLYPSQRLDKVLQSADTDSTGSRLLDPLYYTTLSQLFTSEDTQERFRTVMAAVLTLEQPLPLALLSALPGADPGIIKILGSLLTGVVDGEKPICLLHSSFRDFLLDEARSTVFHVQI
ncbi:hypothetical protein OG21DRAFT_1485805 [Imleria badia]|nr:hypothetical protein OG21DRAFT_1485805 [Imleria badia]